MRTCKVKGCKRKHKSKGYCNTHRQRKYRNRPLIKKCKTCKKVIEHLLWNIYCEKCGIKIRQKAWKEKYQKNKERYLKYRKENYVSIPKFSVSKKEKKRRIRHVFTNGVTEELKPLVSKIKDKVLRDCIKNPGKYLK